MTVPYKFQIEGVEGIERFKGRCLLADEQGLGKSLQSILYAQRNKLARPIIVVCPASLKYNWEGEIHKHSNFECEVLEGRRNYNLRSKKTKIWIINYDITSYWLDALRELKPQLIIADECHLLKNMRAKRTRAVKKLCKKVPHVLALSGTPLTNRPAELFSTLNILRPDVFPSFLPYASQWCNLKRTPFGLKYDGAKNLDSLHKLLLETCMIRRRQADVLDQLPPQTRQVVTLPIRTASEYRRAKGDFLGWLRQNGSGRQPGALKAEQAVKLGELKRLAARLKLEAVFEWVDNFLEESDEKLLLFCIHKKIVRELQERYSKKCVVVTGEVTGKKRQQAFDEINNNPKKTLGILNIQAGGVGWSCTSTSTEAIIEFPWAPGDLLQAEKRVRGIGRGKKGSISKIYYLVGKDTLEEDLLSMLQKKAKILSSVLDGGEQEDDLDVFDLLTQALKKQEKGCF